MEDGGWNFQRTLAAIFHLQSFILVFEAMNHFLAGAVSDDFRFRMTQVEGLAQQFDGFFETRRRFGLHERAKFSGGFVHGICAHADRHAFPGPHGINGERKRGRFSIDGRSFDEQRFAAERGFHLAVGKFSDFQFR